MMRIFVKIMIILMLIVGCTNQGMPEKKAQDRQSQTGQKERVVINTELAAEAENIAQQTAEVKESVAVVIDKDISVAVKVTGLDRLKLKAIRNKVFDSITQMADEYQVNVTTDKKLFSELQKLKQQINNMPPDQNPAGLKTKLEKINKGMRG